MNPHDENLQSSKRRSFFKVGLLFIGGIISAVMAVPLFGFAVLPALKKTSKKYVVLGIVDLLKGSRYKKVNYTFQSKDGWIQTNKKRSVYVTDRGNGNFVVFSRVCSHLNCLVRWEESNKQFFARATEACLTKRETSWRGLRRKPWKSCQLRWKMASYM